jgi:hypothetical protein
MTANTKFYSPTALSDSELYALVPSIFTHGGHKSRSEKYRPIPTITAVRALRNEGWDCYGASQARTRQADRAPYVKHMLKFRHRDSGRSMRVGDTTLETILTNANDGSKGYRLDCGIFRLACLNGMVVKSKDFGALLIRHTGDDVVDRVLSGTYDIARHAAKVMEAPAKWSTVQLSSRQMRDLATSAHELRFGDDERIKSEQLLIPRRPADMGRDLWTIFNVVQENVVQGGISEVLPLPGSRAWTTRAVHGIDANLRLNRQLWAVAESFA